MASELADRIAARIAESSRNEQAETDRLINGEGWRRQTAPSHPACFFHHSPQASLGIAA